MKILWCWRCKMEIPMLDKGEFEKAQILYSKGMKNTGMRFNNPQERFKELLAYYFEITGFRETEPNAILHHSIQLYGPACESCNKPYRTKQASFCAACGNKR